MSQEDEEEEKLVIIVDEREEKMVSCKGGKPTVRLARFLKPSVTSMDQVDQIPPPLIKTKTFKFKKCPFQVYFIGWKWKSLQPNYWKQWVDQLKPTYEAIWKKSGIYDSIMASTYEFRKDEDLIIGLAECWCSDTNTFMFKWGEASMTLEDMFIIGGFSILGKPVTTSLTTELLEIEEKLIQVCRDFHRTKARKASHTGWLKHFMGSNGDLEHAAFLSLWLSRFVFPTRPALTMSKEMFSVAIHLSKGIQIALAPAVLASLYRDLRTLKEGFASSSTTEDCDITVCAPFQIMKLWAWERFPSLQPTPKSLNSGEPRAARWHKLCTKSNIDSVRSTCNSFNEFRWRPYSFELENWQQPSYYKEQGEWVVGSSNLEEELFSFSRCLVPCELVGLDCIEQYVPHRVGMQFGMDQAIPLLVPRANANWESAWRTYDKPIKKICFYIPPCLFESDVTAWYRDWWNQSISNTRDASTSISAHERSLSCFIVSSKSENSESSISPPPGIPSKHWWEPQSSNDEDKMTISDWYKQQQNHVLVKDKRASSDKCFSNAQVQSSCSTSTKTTKRENTMTENNCSYNSSPKRSNIFDKDKSVMGDDSIDCSSETYKHEEMVTADVPGPELEARIDKLEMLVRKFQKKLDSRKGKAKNGGNTSHRGIM